MNAAIAAVVGYLVGSIPFGWLVARAKGVDIVKLGSGNIGATNVGRVLGKSFGYLVFLLDVIKGALPTVVTLWLTGGDELAGIAAGSAAVLGHMFSVFLSFHGGKGVATATGVMAVLLPLPTAFALLAFIATIVAGQIMSLAALVAAVAFAAARLSLVTDLRNAGTLCAILVAVLIIWAHRSNLSRLRRGDERVLASMARAPRLAPGLHALSAGIWCGAGWFFTLGVALPLFTIFNDVASRPPSWLNFGEAPEDLGNRLAGLAVGPLFPYYFAVQAMCGLLAAGSAVGWAFAAPGRISKLRACFFTVALILVAVGWPVSRQVSELREARHVLAPSTSAEARAAFGTWHTISLVLNLSALTLATAGLALAGYPPRREVKSAR